MDLDSHRTPRVLAFWSQFKVATGVDHDIFDVVSFGDSAEMMDELADLVVAGIKRATAPLLRDFTSRGLTPPSPGDLVIVVDGSGEPRCVYRTESAEIRALNLIDEDFAFREGEGDKTLASWYQSHVEYYTRQAAREQFSFSSSIPVVLERFVVVWAPVGRSTAPGISC